jgi:hypothetical protein
VLHQATSARDPLLLRAPVGARRLKQVPAATARGDVAYVATVDDRVVGWIWLSRVSHRDPWSGLRFRLAPAECYADDLWSLPRLSDPRGGAFLLAGLLNDLRGDAPLEWVYGYVDRANIRNQLLLRMVFGSRIVQAVKHVWMLDSRGWQMPFTDRPPGGLCSRGR